MKKYFLVNLLLVLFVCIVYGLGYHLSKSFIYYFVFIISILNLKIIYKEYGN